ncbi:MAG: DUF6599 family protein [Candidatus Brocadiia bacterium]
MKSPSSTRLAAPLALSALLLAGGCGLWRPSPPSPVEVLEATAARLPEVAIAKVREHTGRRLYDYMDGAAETYFAHGFRSLGTADAKWRNTEAVIEVFRLATPDDAKALFDQKNHGADRELPAGAASAAWKAKELEGIFHRGPFFCTIMIYGNDQEAQQLLDTLAAALDQTIAQ